MRAHQVIEDIDDVLRNWEISAHRELSLVRGHMLPSAVTFDFGHYWPAQAHHEFGLEKWGRRQFNLPYPSVFFAGSRDGLAWGIAAAQVDDCYLWATMGYVQMHGVEETPPLTLEKGHVLPMYLAAARPADDGDGFFLSAVPVVISTSLAAEDMRAHAGMVCGQILGMVSMLKSKDVDQKVDSPPRKLNCARERRGRPPIGECRTIVIRPEARKAYMGVDGDGAFRMMHWRRGHDRTIYKGTEKQRDVWVSPCFVGGRPDGEVPPPKSYVFGG
jgi:hypothetical protein